MESGEIELFDILPLRRLNAEYVYTRPTVALQSHQCHLFIILYICPFKFDYGLRLFGWTSF